ncbi:MAG: sigma-54-dependent Fis family transcriptional regulator [Deltaproteobacteria bacterium]|nr:sigma-54-dependent Fis family transcriptional regulator [Deltaproteobacteria bacterium]
MTQPNEIISAFEDLVGSSAAMREVYQLVKALENSTASVLITGESGTGKEKVAQALHRHSTRSQGPFRAVNCAALSKDILESELFGHVKGAFTGAINDKKGIFEASDGGTVFLDEIGEVSSDFQVKLLRVLQEGEYCRLGEDKVQRCDVRILSATHQNLEDLITKGKFRKDLYYRLNVIPIHLKPLRSRSEDIPLLAQHFLKEYSARLNKDLKKISGEALHILQRYSWPGNVRELENIIERAVVLSQGRSLRICDLPDFLLKEENWSSEENLEDLTYQEAKLRAMKRFNQSYLRQLLNQSQGNLSHASAKAGMDRSNFKKLLKKFEIHAQEFRSK